VVVLQLGINVNSHGFQYGAHDEERFSASSDTNSEFTLDISYSDDGHGKPHHHTSRHLRRILPFPPL